MRVIHKDKWHLFCECLNLVYTLSAILSRFISFVFFSLSLSFLLNFFLRSYANQFVEILLMLIHVSLYKERISIALSHCVILNMICRLMQMPMEITLLNPLNDPEHCSLSLPQGPKVNTHNHTHTHVGHKLALRGISKAKFIMSLPQNREGRAVRAIEIVSSV